MNRPFLISGVLGSLAFCTTSLVPYSSRSFESVDFRDTVPIVLDTNKIEEVLVDREFLSPEQKFEQRKAEFRTIYFDGDNTRIIEDYSIFPPVVIININRLYNHFSSTGKNARRLQRVFESEYRNDRIDAIWMPLTQNYTKLTGVQLSDFQIYYRPELEWIENAEHIERLNYVSIKLKQYKDSADVIRDILNLASNEHDLK